MLRGDPCRPNAVTFSSLLTAHLARDDVAAVKQVRRGLMCDV